MLVTIHSLSPNIHIQILQTVFHTFPYKNHLREFVDRSQHFPLGGQLINSLDFFSCSIIDIVRRTLMLVTVRTWRVRKMMVVTRYHAVYPLYKIKDVSKSKICKTLALSSLTVKINFLCNIFGFDVCILVTNKYFSILFECPVLCFDPVIEFIPYKKIMDHHTFLGNCLPTPPIHQHFALREK